jgi:alanine-synthesizing transaminase
MIPRFSTRLDWPAPENLLARKRAALRAAGKPILDFSESNPTRVGLPRADIRALVDEADLRYEPDPRGLARAREALVREYGAASDLRNGAVKLPSERDIFLCASTSEAYGWLFKLLCDPGEAVLVPKPGYPLFDYLAGLEAVEARPYRLEYFHPSGWKLDLESVEAAIAKGGARALVLINPNNPTGSYVGAEEREALVGLCAEAGIAIVADEVFFGFPVEEGEPPSSWLGEERVLSFVLDGLSKRLCLPQLKLGWIAASGPRELLAEAEGRLEIIADTYLSAGTPVMNALPELLAGSDPETLRSRLRENMARLRSVLEEPGSPHRLLSCRGGWTAIIESPRFLSEEELALGLLEEAGLWSQPGFLFDMEREAYFTAGLILEPELLERGARAYLDYFEGLAGAGS